MVIVGALVALAIVGLRPVGGALLICGLALVVFGSLSPRPRRKRERGPYSWEDDTGAGGPQVLYTANPGEVQLKQRGTDLAPEYTAPQPGDIPVPRQQASGGTAEYTTERGDLPQPRDRERAAAEYTASPREMRPDAIEQTAQGPSFTPQGMGMEEIDLPPMAPPPPLPPE